MKTIKVTPEAELSLRTMGARTKLGVPGVMSVLAVCLARELLLVGLTEDDVARAPKGPAVAHQEVWAEKTIEVPDHVADYLDAVARCVRVPVLELVNLVLNRGGKQALAGYVPWQINTWSGLAPQVAMVIAERDAKAKAEKVVGGGGGKKGSA